MHRLAVERLLDGLLVAQVQKAGSLLQNVCQHQQNHIVVLSVLQLLHGLQELLLTVQQILGVHAGNLRHRQVVAGDMELLEVGLQQLIRRTVFIGRRGEYQLSQILQRHVGYPGHPLGQIPVQLRTGGGFEHHRV